MPVYLKKTPGNNNMKEGFLKSVLHGNKIYFLNNFCMCVCKITDILKGPFLMNSDTVE